MNRFTFKKIKNEGHYGSFFPESTDIKLKGKKVGMICESRDSNLKYKIKFTVKDDSQENCNWKWITFKWFGNSEKEVREFIKKRAKYIQEKYDLHLMEDN